jgi:transposase-like protein
VTRDPRQSYAYHLKLRAIGMVIDEGYEQSFVCAALDIPKACLSQWVQAFKAGKLKRPKGTPTRESVASAQLTALEGVTRGWCGGAVISME